jgi:hypothetical protein
MAFLKLGTFVAVTSALFGCLKLKDSHVTATNQVDGKQAQYWYQTYTLDSSPDNSFIRFHKDNKDLLLGNRADLVPETLKGLWFMDGNPVGDQTLNLSKVKPPRSEKEDFYFDVNTPLTFSWTDIAQNHNTINKIAALHLTYSLKFLDCPADVKKEREEMWGMKDGSCTAADKQFMIVTPILVTPLVEISLPANIAYFDAYLTPKNGDFYVWERRSKVFEVVDDFVNSVNELFRRDTKSKDFHRYKFTQVMDKDANVLSSFSRLVDHVTDVAKQNNKDLKDFMLYLCYDGATGCDRSAIANAMTPDSTVSGIVSYGAIPLF